MLTYNFFVSFVSNLNKSLYRFGVEGVEICLIIIPGRGCVNLEIGVPFCAFGIVVFVNLFVACKVAVCVKNNIVASDKPAFSVSAAFCS